MSEDPRLLGDATIEELTVQLVYRLAELSRPDLMSRLGYVATHMLAMRDQSDREWQEAAS